MRCAWSLKGWGQGRSCSPRRSAFFASDALHLNDYCLREVLTRAKVKGYLTILLYHINRNNCIIFRSNPPKMCRFFCKASLCCFLQVGSSLHLVTCWVRYYTGNASSLRSRSALGQVKQ